MCDISLPAGHACGECGIPATVAFGQFAGETRYTCDDHDPLRPPFGAVVNIPSGYHYSKMTAPLAAPPLAAVWPSVEHFTVGGSVSTNIHFAV